MCFVLLKEPTGTHSSGFLSRMGTAELGVMSVGTAGLGWWLDWVIVEVFSSPNDSGVYGSQKAGPG